MRMLKLEWPAHAWALLQCDALGHVRPVSEPDRQAKADVYALSMGRRVAGKAAWRGLVSVQDVLCALSWKVPVREAAPALPCIR